MAEPEPNESSMRSPRSASHSVSFSFMREGSRVWEKAGELPSPLPTKRTRTYSATVRANSGPVFKGVCKNFSRSQGHGYIRPANGGEDIFVHISDIEGEYVPVEGDEVTYKVCPIPPKNVKVQAVEVIITHLNPGTKHETWSGKIISSSTGGEHMMEEDGAEEGERMSPSRTADQRTVYFNSSAQ